MFNYDKFFELLKKRKIKITDIDYLNLRTIYKLKRGENVNTSELAKICTHLQVQPAQIMVFVQDEPKEN